MSTTTARARKPYATTSQEVLGAIAYERYWNAIGIWAYQAHIPDLENIEVKHELFIHLVEALPDFDPDKASEKTFVERILLNKVRDMVRQAKSMKRTSQIPMSVFVFGGPMDIE